MSLRSLRASGIGWVLLGACTGLGCRPSHASAPPLVVSEAPPSPAHQAETPTANTEAPRSVVPPPVAPQSVAPPPEAPHEQRCGLPEGLYEPGWPRTLSDTSSVEQQPPSPGTTTLAFLPDTQYYTYCKYPHLKNQADWIWAQREARNIVAAIGLGDMTDHNDAEEWEFVRTSFGPLMNGFPLLLTTGNHDFGDGGLGMNRSTLFSDYFTKAWARRTGALLEVMAPDSVDDAFYSLDLGKVRLGVLMLEWSPRKRTVAWANRVLSRYADRRVIVVTHAYLYYDGARYDYAKLGASQKWNPLEYGTAQNKWAKDGNHDGEMLWNDLVRRHPNVFLVASGHVLADGAALLESRDDSGNTVHQFVANYQMLDEGGLGYLRLLEILPDGKTLRMKTYSPSLGLFSYAKNQNFTFEVEPPLF